MAMLSCPRCGALVAPDAAFCSKCGLALVPAEPSARSGPGFAALKRQAPPLTQRANPPVKRRPAHPIWGLIFLAGVGLTIWGYVGHSGVASAPAGTATVTYKLTGSAKGANLTYTDGSGNIQQQAGVAVPLGRASGAAGLTFKVAHGAYVSFSAQNNYAAGDLTCSIEADSVVINTGHSSGAYVIVSCSGMVP